MRSLTVIFSCLILLPSLTVAGTVTLEIRHLWEGKEITIPTEAIETAAGEHIDISRLAYLLSEPTLLSKTRQTRIARKNWFAYVDGGNAVSRLVLDGVPEDSYGGLQIYIGLDEATDLADPNQYPAMHPLNPLVNNLHWSPQGGYIYIAMEGHAQGDLGFSYHLGNPRNRVTCEIPLEFEMADSTTISLDFHLDRIFNADEPFKTREQTSTHSREGDPVAKILKERLAGVFSLRSIQQSEHETKPATSITRNTVGTPYSFKLKKGFPIPALPLDFPLTNERVELGRRLFHDARLSRTGNVSCASCHQAEHAFSDPIRFSSGVDKKEGTRNSMSLVNLAWKESFFWDGRAASLREQALMPIQDHLEMDESLENVVKKLSSESEYLELFRTAYGDSSLSAERIGIAIEQFLLTLTSYDSKFDRDAKGEGSLTEQELKGLELFMTEFDPRRGFHGADCFHCHSGPFFSNHRFHNNGLKVDIDKGLEAVTGKETDRGKFVTPSLRNVALTAPYMHDGRFATLEEVVEHYCTEIERSPTLDPNLAKHPLGGISLSKDDKSALVAFLQTLTDEQFTQTTP